MGIALPLKKVFGRVPVRVWLGDAESKGVVKSYCEHVGMLSGVSPGPGANRSQKTQKRNLWLGSSGRGFLRHFVVDIIASYLGLSKSLCCLRRSM